jgi:hypothetical protein
MSSIEFFNSKINDCLLKKHDSISKSEKESLNQEIEHYHNGIISITILEKIKVGDL